MKAPANATLLGMTMAATDPGLRAGAPIMGERRTPARRTSASLRWPKVTGLSLSLSSLLPCFGSPCWRHTAPVADPSLFSASLRRIACASVLAAILLLLLSLSLSLVLAQRRAGPFSSGVTFLWLHVFSFPSPLIFAIWPPSICPFKNRPRRRLGRQAMARGARKRPGAGAKDAPRPAPLPGRGRFYACYLLVSLSEKRKGGKGRTYIGFTVNPKRRIRQHNGELAMGACSTRALRPWQMVLVVYGFSSKARALAFEWAWQHPRRSRSIKDKVLTMTRGSLVGMKGKARILRELLVHFVQEVPRLRVQLLDSKVLEERRERAGRGGGLVRGRVPLSLTLRRRGWVPAW